MKKYKLLKLEPKATTSDNLFFWIKHYYVHIFLDAKLKNINVPNDFDLSKLVNMMLRDSTDTIDKIIDIINQASKGISGVKVSHSTFKPFYEYVCEENIESISNINQSFIKNYILHVRSEETQQTKERYYTHLKKLFNFIQDHNKIENTTKPHKFNIGRYKDGTVEKLFHTRKEKKVPIFLEPYELEKLNKNIVKKKYCADDFEWSKQILILRLLMFGLIKTSELINLKDDDFMEVDNKDILELQVGRRTINLPRAKFIKYLNTYRKSKKCKDSKLFFCSPRNQSPISNQYISKIIGEHLAYANIIKNKATAEVLRNSGMVYLRRAGYSDLKLQKMTGTKAIRTIQDFLDSVSTDHVNISDILSGLTD